MTPRRWLFPLLVLLWLIPRPAAGESLRLRDLGTATQPLGTGWQFHLGDDPHWASPSLDDHAWEPIRVDRSWGEQGHFAYSGFAWYRLHLDMRAAPAQGLHLGLYLPPAADVYEIYWQGRLIGRAGSLPPHARWPYAPTPEVFDLGPAASGVLALRVWKAPLGSFDTGLNGGLSSPPVAGELRAIHLLRALWAYRNLRAMQAAIDLSILIGVVCLGSLAVWLQRREKPIFLWFSLLALSGVLHADWWHGLLGLSWRGDALLATLLSQPLADISTWFILIALLQLWEDARLRRWTLRLIALELGLCLLDAVALTFWAQGWPQWVDGIVSEVILLPELFPLALVGIAIARRRRLPVEIWLVAAFALLADLDQEIGAFLSQGNRFTHWRLWRYLLEPQTLAGIPISLPQLSQLLLLLSLTAAIVRYAVQENRRERARDNEFHSAQELQRVLIPDDLPYILGYEVTSAYRPAQEVGGDFFQLIPQGGGSALLVLGDVSGKGLPAAMAVSLIVGTIRTLAEQLPSPAEMLAGINRRLTGKLHGGFATCVVVFLDADGSLLLASAGHPGPYLNGKEVALPPALPLGLSLDAEFEEVGSVLQTGQQLTLFSDGLLEARNAAGELFGFERLQELTRHCPNATHLAQAAVAFGQEDDITVVTVTRLRVGAEPRSSIAAPRLVPRRPDAS